MSDTNLGRATLRTRLDASGLQSGLQQAGQQLEAFGSRGAQALGRVGAASTKLGDSLSLRVTAPLVAVAGAAANAALRLGNAADQLLDLEQQSGISTDRLQAFGRVAREAGVDVDTLAQAGIQLSRRLSEGGDEAASFTAAAARLGVTVRDETTGALRSLDDLVPELITNLQGVEDITTRNVLANEVFGRSATNLIPVLSLSADEYARLEDEARAAGEVLGRDALDAANQLRIGYENLKAEVNVLSRDVAVELLPVVTEAIRIFRDNVVPAIRSGAETVGRLARAFSDLDPPVQRAILAGGAIVAAVGPVLSIVGRLLTAISRIGPALGALRLAALPLLGPAGLIIGGALAVGALAVALSSPRPDSLTTAVGDARSALSGGGRDSLVGALDQVIDKVDGGTRQSLAGLRDDLVIGADVTGALRALDDLGDKVDDDVREALARLRDDLVVDGDVDAALAELDRLIAKTDGEAREALERLRQDLVLGADVASAVSELDRLIAKTDGDTRDALERLKADLVLEGDVSAFLDALDDVIDAVDLDTRGALERLRADLVQSGDVGVEQARRILTALASARATEVLDRNEALFQRLGLRFSPVESTLRQAGAPVFGDDRIRDADVRVRQALADEDLPTALEIAAEVYDLLRTRAAPSGAIDALGEFVDELRQSAAVIANTTEQATATVRDPGSTTPVASLAGAPGTAPRAVTGGTRAAAALAGRELVEAIFQEISDAGAFRVRLAAFEGTEEALLESVEERIRIIDRGIARLLRETPSDVTEAELDFLRGRRAELRTDAEQLREALEQLDDEVADTVEELASAITGGITGGIAGIADELPQVRALASGDFGVRAEQNRLRLLIAQGLEDVAEDVVDAAESVVSSIVGISDESPAVRALASGDFAARGEQNRLRRLIDEGVTELDALNAELAEFAAARVSSIAGISDEIPEVALLASADRPTRERRNELERIIREGVLEADQLADELEDALVARLSDVAGITDEIPEIRRLASADQATRARRNELERIIREGPELLDAQAEELASISLSDIAGISDETPISQALARGDFAARAERNRLEAALREGEAFLEAQNALYAELAAARPTSIVGIRDPLDQPIAGPRAEDAADRIRIVEDVERKERALSEARAALAAVTVTATTPLERLELAVEALAEIAPDAAAGFERIARQLRQVSDLEDAFRAGEQSLPELIAGVDAFLGALAPDEGEAREAAENLRARLTDSFDAASWGFTEQVILAGARFAASLIESIRSGDIGGAITAAFNAAGQIGGAVSTFGPALGLIAPAAAPVIGFVSALLPIFGGILGGLFGRRPQAQEESEREAEARRRARQTPAFTVRISVSQTNNYGSSNVDARVRADNDRRTRQIVADVLREIDFPALRRAALGSTL